MGGRQNLYGSLIRRFRIDAKWSQETFATKLKVAGWDIDQVVVAYIENGQRNLLDYELKFILDVFGKKCKDLDRE